MASTPPLAPRREIPPRATPPPPEAPLFLPSPPSDASSSLSLLIVADEEEAPNIAGRGQVAGLCTPPPQRRGDAGGERTVGGDTASTRIGSPTRLDEASITPHRAHMPKALQRVSEWVVKFSPLPTGRRMMSQDNEADKQAGEGLPPPWSTMGPTIHVQRLAHGTYDGSREEGEEDSVGSGHEVGGLHVAGETQEQGLPQPPSRVAAKGSRPCVEQDGATAQAAPVAPQEQAAPPPPHTHKAEKQSIVRSSPAATPPPTTPTDPHLVAFKVCTLSGVSLRLTANVNMSLAVLCDHVATYLRVPLAQVELKYLPCDWLLSGAEVERVRHGQASADGHPVDHRSSPGEQQQQQQQQLQEHQMGKGGTRGKDRSSSSRSTLPTIKGRTKAVLPADWPAAPLHSLPLFPSPPSLPTTAAAAAAAAGVVAADSGGEGSRMGAAKVPVLFLLILSTVASGLSPSPLHTEHGKGAKEEQASLVGSGMRTPPRQQRWSGGGGGGGSGGGATSSPWERLSPPPPAWMRRLVTQLSPGAKRQRRE